VVACIVLFLAAIGVFLSYTTSKDKAVEIARSQSVQISPLEGNLVLFIGNKFSPCWLFRGENEKALTGATFDVYVPFFGRVIDTP
jgi:hypothetical protein